MKCAFLIATYLCLWLTTSAQVRPANGDTLHYRLIGFAVPEKPGATYRLQVLDGTTTVTEQDHASNRIVTTLPEFGKSYRWRVVYFVNSRTADSTAWFQFYILPNPFSDKKRIEMEVITPADKHRDMLVFVDNTRSLYNLQGEPVWFLPAIPEVADQFSVIRDIKLTPQNTISFLQGEKMVGEIDYDGNVLWTAPNDGTVSGERKEGYHHEFTKLSNGHYMVAGTKKIKREIPLAYVALIKDSAMYQSGGKQYADIECGTLIEYDSSGKVVWSWVSGTHFSDADLFTPIDSGKLSLSTHMNAFYFDEARQVIYISFRDINRVMKISYPSGEVLANYGANYMQSPQVKGNGLFYGQHMCRLDSKGRLYIFNNNNQKRTGGKSVQKTSTVLLLKEPENGNGNIRKLWEFSCDIDTLAPAFASNGCGAYELDNGDMLVCMGIGERIFIVQKNKKVIWNARLLFHTQRGELQQQGYRASPVYPEQLQQLLFR